MSVCASCPVRAECREWSLRQDVHGVCGGLTRAQRVAWQRAHAVDVGDMADYLPREVAALDELSETKWRLRGHGTAEGRARQVGMLADRGHTAASIAELMGITVRSVNRLLEIAVHHLGVELGPQAVITVAVDPPCSIAGRGFAGEDVSSAA